MHENYGNLADRLDFYNMLINQVDVKVLAVAYRGYSGNQGSPNEKAIKKDTETLLNFI
jgi:hypothetical protein